MAIKKKKVDTVIISCWRCHINNALKSPPSIYCEKCIDFYRRTGIKTVLTVAMSNEIKKDLKV